MKNILTSVCLVALLGLSACGTSSFDRGASGGMIGLAAGAAIGVPVIGAAAGVVVGLSTDKEDVYLGKMPWDWDLDEQ